MHSDVKCCPLLDVWPQSTCLQAASLLVCSKAAGLLHTWMTAHLVLPLKLGPHGAELHVRARCGRDVVHDVDVDVIQHHHSPVPVAAALVDEAAKDGACLRAADLDVGPAAASLT